MNAAGHLTFTTTPVSIVLTVVVLIVTAMLGYHAWRRSCDARSQGMLELLRWLIVAFVALLLNQPEWIEEYRPETKPAITVLWDNSQSMKTIDVLSDASTQPLAISRAEAISPLARPSTWRSLEDRFNVIIQPIEPGFDGGENRGLDANGNPGGGTDLGTPLLETVSRVNQLRGVVLVSDGDWNQGPPPVEAASRLRMSQVPIFTVAAGSPSKLPDLELTSINLPTFGAAGKPIRVPVTIDSSLPREFMTTITLEDSSGQTVTKDVRIAPMGRTFESINWKPEKVGDYTLTISVPEHPDETIADNNARSAPISIRREQLKVLIVESYPRWEYRYLRDAGLSRDPGVEVSCLLFHPGLHKPGGGSRDYIQGFPEAIEDLAQFDVVFLGDVGLDDDQLTLEQCELIKGLVERQASGLVFIPGWQGRQMSLSGTPLAELCPVVMDEQQPRGWGSRVASRFELTQRGRSSLLTRLADSETKNVQVWEDLPGFQWYAAVIRAKAGSDVLAVHEDTSNQYGRLPLLVTRTFGAGKVLFMGTDGAVRWRKGVEDKYHYRFWGQVVRWMAYQRNMAEGETMRLFYLPDQPLVRQTLTFNAARDRSEWRTAAGRGRARQNRHAWRPQRDRSFAGPGPAVGRVRGTLHAQRARRAPRHFGLWPDIGDPRNQFPRDGQDARTGRSTGGDRMSCKSSRRYQGASR